MRLWISPDVTVQKTTASGEPLSSAQLFQFPSGLEPENPCLPWHTRNFLAHQVGLFYGYKRHYTPQQMYQLPAASEYDYPQVSEAFQTSLKGEQSVPQEWNSG